MAEQFDYDEATTEEIVERVEELGLDEERVARTMLGYVAGGADEVDALAWAVDDHDLSGLDETQAAAKIAAREGWS